MLTLIKKPSGAEAAIGALNISLYKLSPVVGTRLSGKL